MARFNWVSSATASLQSFIWAFAQISDSKEGCPDLDLDLAGYALPVHCVTRPRCTKLQTGKQTVKGCGRKKGRPLWLGGEVREGVVLFGMGVTFVASSRIVVFVGGFDLGIIDVRVEHLAVFGAIVPDVHCTIPPYHAR
ncbi:hypothetical protein B0H14DRAFT_2619126 [Mycena olivaceomarginata]|nr:hypothetical protein B0H14DRAFT_2619126 [Mycena olivaceomarginata]